MNCMEVRALVEDALDDSLTGNRKRTLALHLSRCDDCRAFFAAEREEHRRWFQAMNEPEARRHLPEGFVDDFIAKMIADHTQPKRIWAFTKVFRRVAAVLVAMLLFAGISYAAAMGIRGVEAANQDGISANQGDSAANLVADGGEMVGRVVLNAPDSPDAYQLPTTDYQLEPNQGVKTMTRKKAAAAALTAAMAAAPLASANGDEYQFIVSSDPVAAETVGSSSASSATAALTVGTLADGVVCESEFEARSRTKDESPARALRSDKFKSIIISIR